MNEQTKSPEYLANLILGLASLAIGVLGISTHGEIGISAIFISISVLLLPPIRETTHKFTQIKLSLGARAIIIVILLSLLPAFDLGEDEDASLEQASEKTLSNGE
ncbi:MAG: hypothetical protein PVF65_12010 [Sphingomonadales bacterium]|jgi:hypothetical protein